MGTQEEIELAIEVSLAEDGGAQGGEAPTNTAAAVLRRPRQQDNVVEKTGRNARGPSKVKGRYQNKPPVTPPSTIHWRIGPSVSTT